MEDNNMPIPLSEVMGKVIQEHPKYGPIRLLGTDSKDGMLCKYNKCEILFDNTGYRTTLTYDAISKNKVHDYLYPDILGIACVGYASNRDDPQLYKTWRNMLHKCYNPDNPYYKSFGALGYCVNPRWFRFDYFMEDFYKYPKPLCDPDIQIQFKIKPELVEKGCKEFSFENCGLFANELDIKFGTVYHSNGYGDFVPLEYVTDKFGDKAVRIKFVLTGYETIIKPRLVLTGTTTDPYFPLTYGIGYRGPIDTIDKDREYGIWHRMLSRCYNPNDKSYKFYGGSGVTVCERWHCFANFYNDIKFLPNYDKWVLNQEPYELDKDYLQQGIPLCQKIYSPQTCCFLLSSDNVSMASVNIHNNSNRDYYGVSTNMANNFAVRIRNINMGTYSNAEAAANAKRNG